MVSIYGFDRGVLKPLEPLVDAHHRLILEGQHDPHTEELMDLLSWVEAEGCAFHDAQNAQKWSRYPTSPR